MHHDRIFFHMIGLQIILAMKILLVEKMKSSEDFFVRIFNFLFFSSQAEARRALPSHKDRGPRFCTNMQIEFFQENENAKREKSCWSPCLCLSMKRKKKVWWRDKEKGKKRESIRDREKYMDSSFQMNPYLVITYRLFIYMYMNTISFISNLSHCRIRSLPRATFLTFAHISLRFRRGPRKWNLPSKRRFVSLYSNLSLQISLSHSIFSSNFFFVLFLFWEVNRL